MHTCYIKECQAIRTSSVQMRCMRRHGKWLNRTFRGSKKELLPNTETTWERHELPTISAKSCQQHTMDKLAVCLWPLTRSCGATSIQPVTPSMCIRKRDLKMMISWMKQQPRRYCMADLCMQLNKQRYLVNQC